MAGSPIAPTAANGQRAATGSLVQLRLTQSKLVERTDSTWPVCEPAGRANLIRALATTVNAPISGPNNGDRNIREKLLAELRSQRWAEASPDNITIKDGIVHLWCSYISDRERRALIVAAEGIAGVRAVEDHMISATVEP